MCLLEASDPPRPADWALMTVVISTVLVAKAVWFAAGAVYFGVLHRSAARLVMSRAVRGHPLAETVASVLPFLGGLNLALAAVSIVTLVDVLVSGAIDIAPMLFCLALAHATQIGANLRVLRRGRRREEGTWPVLRGLMRVIFITDGVLVVVTIAAAVLSITRWS